MQLNNGDTVGPYIIEQVISQGGMSHIYLAVDAGKPHYRVALKFNASEKSAFQDLLRREADVLATVRHPNIVRIYPLRLQEKKVVYQARAKDVPSRPWYFSMEYVAGGGLEEYMPRMMQFPIPWRIELFYQVLIAVHFMHGAGYGHCDLKPENILLRERPRADRLPQPVLIDLGSVSSIGRRERLTVTPDYAPPELIRAARDPENRSLLEPESLPPAKGDVWALGAILYEMLASVPLVSESDQTAIAETILKGEWHSIRSYQPDVHESLEILVSMMLHPNPHSRPPLEELIEAIEEKIASVAPPRIPAGSYVARATGQPA